MGQVRVGTSGWRYAPWRGDFYPRGLPQARELDYAAQRMSSIEVNASFYALQCPQTYLRWAAATPEDFVFAVKGNRYITHLKRLRDVEVPLANFFASGVLALGAKLGPVLWQLPPSLPFDPGPLGAFLDLLPAGTAEAARLARRHEARLADRAWTSVDADRPLRHAVEVRHPSFADPAFVQLLRRHGVALVAADTAGRWPYLEDVTAGFVYLRLHGGAELYTSGYGEVGLRRWATRVTAWRDGRTWSSQHTVARPVPPEAAGRDVYVYFDNDARGYAPHDALTLQRLLSGRPAG